MIFYVDVNLQNNTPTDGLLFLSMNPLTNQIKLRYFIPQVPITGKMLNGYPMFSVKNIVQNVKLIELWGKNLVPLHFVTFKSSFF